MKTLSLALILVIFAVAPAASQVASLRGTITIKKMSGNNLANFSCSSLSVLAKGLGSSGEPRVTRASGNIASRICRYSLPRVSAGVPIVVSVTADFPNSCDLRVFKADSSFPMTLSNRQSLIYNPTIQQITCTVVR